LHVLPARRWQELSRSCFLLMCKFIMSTCCCVVIAVARSSKFRNMWVDFYCYRTAFAQSIHSITSLTSTRSLMLLSGVADVRMVDNIKQREMRLVRAHAGGVFSLFPAELPFLFFVCAMLAGEVYNRCCSWHWCSFISAAMPVVLYGGSCPLYVE